MTDTADKDESPRKPGEADQNRSAGAGQPEWAMGLKKLYDSVVEEPLPDQFRDLLDKLDSPK